MKTVIYHGNCNDGFCAAWVAWRKFGGDAEYLAYGYNSPPPKCVDHDVFVLDFSFPRADLLDLKTRAKSLLVLDHHKTAEADLEGLDFCQFDMVRSGAGMTWDYFFGGERPWIIEAVQDRDLWLWKYPSSKELNASITTWPRAFDYWDAQFGDGRGPDGHGMKRAIDEGRAINRYIEQYVDEMCERARMVEFEGYTVPCVNVPYKGISEICGKLAESAAFSLGWAQEKSGRFVYSLRSRGDFDVSAIAKKYGGGGHKNAAGFNSDKLLI